MRILNRVRSITGVLLLTLSASTVDAKPFFKRGSFWWKASLVCAGGAHGADLASTMTVLALRRGYEANVLLAKIEDPTNAGMVKGSGAVGAMLLTNVLYKRNPKTAILLNFATCGGLGVVANRNASLYRGLPK